jgi:hypothetical protein
MISVTRSGLVEDIQQIGDAGHDFGVFADDLVLLQSGQALQTQIKNRASAASAKP